MYIQSLTNISYSSFDFDSNFNFYFDDLADILGD